ncbi:unnamed protein product, partial [Rotaria magnacalcarata]
MSDVVSSSLIASLVGRFLTNMCLKLSVNRFAYII